VGDERGAERRCSFRVRVMRDGFPSSTSEPPLRQDWLPEAPSLTNSGPHRVVCPTTAKGKRSRLHMRRNMHRCDPAHREDVALLGSLHQISEATYALVRRGSRVDRSAAALL